jgi:hypothetical protein
METLSEVNEPYSAISSSCRWFSATDSEQRHRLLGLILGLRPFGFAVNWRDHCQIIVEANAPARATALLRPTCARGEDSAAYASVHKDFSDANDSSARLMSFC